MSQHHKNFVVTGYFVCLIALVAGVFILALNNFNENKNAIVSPGPESTQSVNSSWQTYRNEKYGFEIKYPVAWNVTSNQDDPSFVFNNKIELSILVDRNGSRSYFEEKVNTADCLRGDDVGGCALIPQKVSKIFAGGLEGYLREYSDNSQSFAYFADEKNNITVMLYTGNLPDKEMFREIVSTFKFIEPAVDTSNGSTTLTTGWKTYRNDKYWFEFEYPSRFGRLLQVENDKFEGENKKFVFLDGRMLSEVLSLNIEKKELLDFQFTLGINDDGRFSRRNCYTTSTRAEKNINVCEFNSGDGPWGSTFYYIFDNDNVIEIGLFSIGEMERGDLEFKPDEQKIIVDDWTSVKDVLQTLRFIK